MNRFAFSMTSIALVAAMLLTADAAPRKRRSQSQPAPRSIEKVRSEQSRTKREIRETDKQLTENLRRTERELRQLDGIRDESARLESEIRLRRAAIDTIGRRMKSLSDSIDLRQRHVDKLRDAFIEAMRATQGNRSATDRLTFLFSANTFKEAWRRFRYLGEFGRWQKERTAELRREVVSLDSARTQLQTLLADRQQQASLLAADQGELSRRQQESADLVKKLQARGGELRTVLQQKEQRARELDRELDRLIAAEQARIERERREAEAREAERRRKAEAEAKRKAQEQERRKAESEASSPAKPSAPSSPEPAAKPTPAAPASPARQQQPESIADAERRLTGDFASNKGRLLFPVSGAYRIARGYGRQRHPDMPHVTTDNSGIDIAVKGGTSARAVFGGRVASIMQYPGCGNIVIVRHGEFYSVYSNMGQLAVKVGDDVGAGQRLGQIFTDPDSGRATLHFELRRGSAKLNPMEWVR